MSTGQLYPGMHLVDDDLVRRLIAGQFPQWAGLAVERWWEQALEPGPGWAAGVAAC